MDFLNIKILDNSVQNWLFAMVITIAVAMIGHLFKKIGIRRLKKISQFTETTLDDSLVDVLGHTKWMFLIIISLFIGSLFITFAQQARAIINHIAVIALIIQGGIWINAAVNSALEHYRNRQQTKDSAATTTVNALGFLNRIVLWSIILLLVLDNLGVDITALITGLGVGGVAVALAVQNILGDLFSSLSIVLDKPFMVGDFLIIDTYMGSVEYIGLKTTRVRSLSGEQLIFSNTDLLRSRIRNFGRMFERRVVFSIGVTYQTEKEKLEAIPNLIKSAIEEHQKIRFDRSHFNEYRDSSLNFETVYYILDPDYNIYMDIQQAVNLRIFERFKQENIEFAYPTRTIHMNNQ